MNYILLLFVNTYIYIPLVCPFKVTGQLPSSTDQILICKSVAAVNKT